jgi:HEPN domain-containing protein
LKKLPKKFKVEENLIIAAKNLDKHYVTSRYPNGFASGAPKDYYIKKDAEEATENAEKIFEYCKNQIPSLRKETD